MEGESETMRVRVDPKIGINKLIVEAPQTYFSYVELANALNSKSTNGMKVEPMKIKDGLGIEKVRLPTYSQSNVTMAANAIYSFIKNVDSNPYDKEKFFAEKPVSIYYATESNPDFSRPEAEVALGLVYSRLLEEDEKRYRPYVEALKNAGMQQNTFACAGAGLALSSALSEIYLNSNFGIGSSAIIISADTAVYDSRRAPDAETTQGSAATLMWITTEPELIAVNYKLGYGRFNIPLPDFTKFGFDTPIVYGEFSKRGYVYAVAMALTNLENKLNIEHKDSAEEYRNEMRFLISHVPFPKQAIYFASFLFEHYLKNYEHYRFEEMQKRESLGASPIDDKTLIDIFNAKLRGFNGSHDGDIIDYMTSDKEINAYWKWLGKLKNQPEFESFIKSLNIPDALELPSQVGNSYTGSTIIAVASLLKKNNIEEGDKGICIFFGSGMVATAYQLEITAVPKSIEKNLIISMDSKRDIELPAKEYEELHNTLINGDAKRTMIDENNSLIEQDKKMLKDSLPEGFLIKRRNANGTWEAEFVENGIRHTLRPRL
ncbi:MAG: hydroxymethylglutaryl-CoA synthase [Methanothrix sp.]